MTKRTRELAASWNKAAYSLPQSIKQAIESEAVKAFELNNPRALTPHYITRNLLGQADIIALSTYAKQTLAKLANL